MPRSAAIDVQKPPVSVSHSVFVSPASTQESILSKLGKYESELEVEDLCCVDEDLFADVLNCDGDVDMWRLVEVARLVGIPESFRCEVWKCLLGVNAPLQEPDEQKRKRDMFRWLERQFDCGDATTSLISRKIRNEIYRTLWEDEVERLSWSSSSSSDDEDNDESEESDVRKRIERLISIYLLDHPGIEFAPHMVHLLVPLLHVMKLEAESEVYLCFCKLMQYVKSMVLPEGADHAVAQFTMLFRSLDIELFEAFESEGFYSVREWVLPWMQGLLSRELPLENVLRLWDVYFAEMAVFSDHHLMEDSEMSSNIKTPNCHNHMFVLLSILQSSREMLIESEHSEIRVFLQNLPHFDIQQLLAESQNIRACVRFQL